MKKSTARRIAVTKEDRVEFKTAYIAGIAAGLIFGILLRLGKIGFEMFRTGLRL
ncbi:MAG: hypothetical protein ACM3ZC_16805 [Bacteroidota bacterium]